MGAKLTRLTHKIAIQLHLVAESCTICRSRSRQPVRKLLDIPSYNVQYLSSFPLNISDTEKFAVSPNKVYRPVLWYEYVSDVTKLMKCTNADSLEKMFLCISLKYMLPLKMF
jgi:hypothetical protein